MTSLGKTRYIKPLQTLNLERKMKAGAFGNWKKDNERFDPSIIKQTSEKGVSCVSAVGEMLLRVQNIVVNQKQILAKIGEPAGVGDLAKFLNTMKGQRGHWIAGYDATFNVDSLKKRTNFALILKAFGSDAHAVFIKEYDGRFIINDPFDQSYYEMSADALYDVWTGGYIYYE